MSSFNLFKLIEDVFAPELGERVTVLTDLPRAALTDNPQWSERRQIAAEWRAAFQELGALRGFTTNPLVHYPATGAHSGPLPVHGAMDGQTIDLEEIILRSTLVVVLSEFSATGPLIQMIKDRNELRAASLPQVQRRMEQTALAADYSEVQRRVRFLRELLQQAEGANLDFDTQHSVYFDLRYRDAFADDGYLHRDRLPPRLINLPSGEAFSGTYEGERPGEPSRTAGTIPVDYGGERVLFQVEANRIVAVEGSGEQADRMRGYFAADPARANIAELGLGANPAAVVWGNVLEDEKAGIHWAYGRSDFFGGRTGVAQFRSPETVVHQDIVYAENSPIRAARLLLHYPGGTTQEIYNHGWTCF